MTGAQRPGRGAVEWLAAQSVAFGAMAALLGIVANAIFLNAYGAGWLPVTYIAIGAAGIALSGGIARAAQRFDLVGISLVILGGATALIALSWVIDLGGDAAWVSIPLVVLFPILIQLGFVFIGAQAGRILDIAGIKASFPRIMGGFPVGAIAGGLLGGQLVTWLGRTEHLLLVTAIAQGAFAALVWVTGRRYPAQLGNRGTGAASDATSAAHASPAADGPQGATSPRVLAGRFVALILGYQVLSALGSQVSDYLVFDRAIAQYPAAADLARYIAIYTTVMNVVIIVFLLALAGPLLRRFGLRLGIAANPLVVTIFAVAMIATYAVTGGRSLVLLWTVSAARIVDLALSDGTTRTSINAMYQVLPERTRLSAQATVEGMGQPIAIGVAGVIIIVLNALPFALTATIAVMGVVCALWSWAAVRLYRAYGPALVQALHRQAILSETVDLEATPGDEVVALRLLSSRDARSTRLGLDLLTAMSSSVLTAELKTLATDPRPNVRVSALTGLAASGDELARGRLAAEVGRSVASPDVATRLRAARALEALDAGDRAAAARLLVDDDVSVRCAALESIRPGDSFAVAPAIAALGDARFVGAAAGAVGRLGDAVLPELARQLDAAGVPAAPPVLRVVRATTTRTPARDEILRRHAGHPDRDLGLVVLERLIAPEPASDETGEALAPVLADDLAHARRILAAEAGLFAPLPALPAGDDRFRATDEPVRRALDDELDLVRRRVVAGRLVRHGSDRLGSAMLELGGGGPTAALALEALDVHLGPTESGQVLPLLDPGLSNAQRLRRLPAAGGVAGTSTGGADGGPDASSVLRDLVEDDRHEWRSPWLRACAIHAAIGRGLLDGFDLRAARALGDPIVDELLA